MLRKEEILERTSNGLAVFKHYLPGNWRIGRNFLNPLYEDSKASCNIYFDRRGGIYKMKDFGNDSYSGDCFFLVGQLKGLDCNRAADFVEILEIIDRDLGLGLASGIPVSVPPATVRRTKPKKRPKSPSSPTSSATIRHHARTAGTLQGLLAPGIQQRNGRGQTVHLHFIGGRTHVRLQGQTVHQAVPPVLHAPLPLRRQLRRELLFRAGTTASQRRHAIHHGRRERRVFAGGARFSRYLLQQRNGDDTAHAGLSADVPLQTHRPAL